MWVQVDMGFKGKGGKREYGEWNVLKGYTTEQILDLIEHICVEMRARGLSLSIGTMKGDGNENAPSIS
jgi:hypothetical protein